MQAIADGVARVTDTWQNVYDKAMTDIKASRSMTKDLMAMGYIKEPPQEMLQQMLNEAIAEVR
jgi:malate dehydrogenase (oxaloacetate-decarboxylating)